MAGRITLADARHVAGLARLALTDDQAAALARELDTILEHMSVLARVDTADVELYGAGDGESAESRGETRRAAIPLAESPDAFAPDMRDGFFLVPRLGSHEDPTP